jgi:hypothetical protein
VEHHLFPCSWLYLPPLRVLRALRGKYNELPKTQTEMLPHECFVRANTSRHNGSQASYFPVAVWAIVFPRTMKIQNMANSVLALFLVFVCSSCSTRHEWVEPTTPWIAAETEITSEGGFSIGASGAKTGKFENDTKYDSIYVTLTAGNRPPVRWKSDKRFVIGKESAQGLAIQKLIEVHRPWEWKTTTVPHFADNLHFSGKIGDKEWTYLAIYPDKKLEQFLVGLRKCLKTGQTITISSPPDHDLSLHWTSTVMAQRSGSFPDFQYWTDCVKSAFAETITLGYAAPYIIRIGWNADSVFKICNGTKSFGWPFE